MSDAPKEILDLGADFEIIEDAAPTSSPAEPSAAETAVPTSGGQPVQVSSVMSWQGLGLLLGISGLLAQWPEGPGIELLKGLALAFALWQLLTSGLGAVKPTVSDGKPIAGGLLVLAGLAGILLGDSESGGHFLAPILALIGGPIAAAAGTSLGRAKDQKLALPKAHPLDPQFSQSLVVYLLALAGMLGPWGSGGDRGMDSVFGLITLLCTLMAIWASWVGSWKLWSMPLVTGKLGILLFLAPVEILLLGLMGLLRFAGAGNSVGDMALGAYPAAIDADGVAVAEQFLVHGAAPLLTFLAGVAALGVLGKSAKAAMAMAEEKKKADIEARKAARSKRKKK